LVELFAMAPFTPEAASVGVTRTKRALSEDSSILPPNKRKGALEREQVDSTTSSVPSDAETTS
jgi:hypothetical protein